jgi:hypothetical protein
LKWTSVEILGWVVGGTRYENKTLFVATVESTLFNVMIFSDNANLFRIKGLVQLLHCDRYIKEN